MDPLASCKPNCRKRTNCHSASKWKALLLFSTLFTTGTHERHQSVCKKEKVHEILRYAEACSLRDYLILRVLWESGLRVSELAALTPRDLEPHNQVINVINGKGNKSRRAYVDSGTMDLLCSYILRADIPDDCGIFGVKTNQMRNIVKRYGTVSRRGHPSPHLPAFVCHSPRQIRR